MKIIFIRIFVVLLILNMPVAQAEEAKAIHQQRHLDALSVYRKNADDYVAKNLNRFGLNQLLNYDASLDSMYKTEVNDTVEAFKTNYDKSHQARSSTISGLHTEINDLSGQKEKAKSGFTGLLRKAVIASLIWLGIVLLLMQIRSRALKRVQLRLDESNGQLSESERRMSAGREMLKLAHDNENEYHRLNEKANSLQKIITEAPLSDESGFSKEDADRLKSAVGEVVRAASSNQKIAGTILTQEFPAGIEKENANLNQLCDQCFELVYSGMKSDDPDLKISVSKDLEKNLPQIKLIPDAVIQLLLNVLVNAFQSVKEKQEKKVKGYVPKVTISTRVLPRFLQVRVHDNGDGMTDDIIQRVSEPYFTMKPAAHAAGLGMYFASKIASEMHQGELKIESEPGNKTDVYIKFFTS